VINNAQITTYWMVCGCVIQTGQIATDDKEEARRFATNHASQIINDPVVSRIQHKPGSSNAHPVILVTVRPAHQICDRGLLHPASYVSQGASNA
jgi:hypothetical protein